MMHKGEVSKELKITKLSNFKHIIILELNFSESRNVERQETKDC